MPPTKKNIPKYLKFSQLAIELNYTKSGISSQRYPIIINDMFAEIDIVVQPILEKYKKILSREQFKHKSE